MATLCMLMMVASLNWRDEMEFVELGKDRYLVKNSNGVIVDKKEKLKLEKKELIIKDVEGCGCQGETTKLIKKIDEELANVESEPIKKTRKTNK